MICPQCNSEYRDGYTHCVSCDVALIEPVVEAAEPQVELVKVYETGNAAIIPLVESLFDDAGIEYMVKGESIQDLIGGGRLGGGYNIILGPVYFFVRADDADEAKAIVDRLALETPDAAVELPE
ncbi:MAG: hypothetical protein QOH21_3038 [Acidobacteriota bacterium]|jgi:hypothetical protein|nr:hypothetical protein [Acidobacteriota bacterium]